VELATGVKS